MDRPKHTGAVIVMTVFAIALAMSSFTMPFYEVTDGRTTDSGGVHYDSIEFYSTYFRDSGLRSYAYDYEEVGALIKILWLLTWLWVVVAMAYVVRIVNIDSSEYKWWQAGFVAGWVLAFFALLPTLVFALLISDAVSFRSGFIGSTDLDAWGPSYGWIFLFLATMIQVLAVLIRNVPAIAQWTKGPDEVPAEVAARGDLPIR